MQRLNHTNVTMLNNKQVLVINLRAHFTGVAVK